MDDLSMNVELRCPTCGSTNFLFDKNDDTKPITCTDCSRIFPNKKELIDMNGTQINQATDVLKEEAFSQIKDEFKKMLRKFK